MLSKAIVVSLVLSGVHCSPDAGITTTTWRRNTSLDGIVPRTDVGMLLGKTTPSDVSCVSLCARCHACVGAMYNAISGQCQGHFKDILTAERFPKLGNRYFTSTGLKHTPFPRSSPLVKANRKMLSVCIREMAELKDKNAKMKKMVESFQNVLTWAWQHTNNMLNKIVYNEYEIQLNGLRVSLQSTNDSIVSRFKLVTRIEGKILKQAQAIQDLAGRAMWTKPSCESPSSKLALTSMRMTEGDVQVRILKLINNTRAIKNRQDTVFDSLIDWKELMQFTYGSINAYTNLFPNYICNNCMPTEMVDIN